MVNSFIADVSCLRQHPLPLNSIKWLKPKPLLREGLSLVYKFRKIIVKNDFSLSFQEEVFRYKKIGYNINVMRQTACLVVNPIKVNSFAYLFNCTTVGRTSD